MALKDIEKLREKVEKDPNSKLFVPLAEEYRKEGMLDDAIGVLLDGLERQPAYMSAKVSLGKIYTEKGMMKEARAEFEDVIKSIPDNLYAHKKLAEIYREMGEKDLAAKSYRTVLKLNPIDEEALNRLREVESEEPGLEASGDVESSLPPGLDSTPFAEETITGEMAAEETTAEVVGEETGSQEDSTEEMLEESPDDDLHAFKDSLFGGPEGEEPDRPEEVILEESILEDEDEVMSFGDLGEVAEEEEAASWDVTEELTSEEVPSATDEEPVPPVHGMDEVSPGGGSILDADRLISKGDFSGALKIYRSILASNPEEKGTLQRMEELRSLLKLVGRDKEALVSDLNDFLEAVKKRRDDFFRSS